MSTSPFHGIFSGFAERELEQDTPEQDDALPSPPPAIKHATPAADQSVGRVAVDIYEQDDYYIIKAPIAGVRLLDLDIEVNDTVVTIRGHRRQTDAIPSGQYYLQECFWGPFSRSVTLPCSVDPKRVKATFNKECVLKVLVPKEEKVKIVRITEG